MDYILTSHSNATSLIRQRVLDTMYVNSDHHAVEAVFAWRYDREPEPEGITWVPSHRLKDPKVRAAFKIELDKLWDEVQHIEFDSPEDRYT